MISVVRRAPLVPSRIFHHLHHQILLTDQFRDVAHRELLLFFTRHTFGVRHDVRCMKKRGFIQPISTKPPACRKCTTYDPCRYCLLFRVAPHVQYEFPAEYRHQYTPLSRFRGVTFTNNSAVMFIPFLTQCVKILIIHTFQPAVKPTTA